MKIPYIAVFVFVTTIISFSLSQVYAENPVDGTNIPTSQYWSDKGAIIYHVDDNYIIEEFASGLNFPTAMTFVGDDILVIEKSTGKVIRIQENGVIHNESVLDLPVSSGDESGLLGITSISNHVYLYFTESLSGSDKSSIQNSRHVVYRYDWNGENLTNPVLIKEFPIPHNQDAHVGGAMTNGQNNEIYFVIGDQRQHGIYQNIPANTIYETSSIFKIDAEEMNVELFAMGIRNSFGLAVDPVTGFLWDTENGDRFYDEINLVKPGFNSGWKMVMGPVDRINLDTCEYLNELDIHSCLEWIIASTNTPQTIPPPFENFEYSDPEFSWWETVGLTAIEFPDKDGFGKYSDWLFVADFNNGKIYKFQLNADRTGFVFSNPGLTDLVQDHTRAEITDTLEVYPNLSFELEEILFAINMPGGITDIEFHAGAMYVNSIFDGSIYKIYPKESVPPLEQYEDEVGGVLTALRETPNWYKPTLKYVDPNGHFSIEYPERWVQHTYDITDFAAHNFLTFPISFFDDFSSTNFPITSMDVIPFNEITVIDGSFGSSDQQKIDTLKKYVQEKCDAGGKTASTVCSELTFLGSGVIDRADGKEAYTALYRTKQTYGSGDINIEIHITSKVYDGNHVWYINSQTREKLFENHMHAIIHTINSLTLLNPSDSDITIPAWIKNNAGWWASDQIPDSTFLQGIQFLIKEGIMIIPSTETSGSTGPQEVPGWIKNNAGWWANGQIDDNTFVSGIQYLVQVGIIKVS